MPIDNHSRLLPGLLPAVWSGISFHMPDTSTVAGRRVAEHLFPGIDTAAYDDHGELPEEVSVSGVLLGDDYIAQAKRLRAAFKKPGPSSLMHPWWGGLTVILEYPGEISFSEKELRVARFDATFKVVSTTGFSASNELSATRLLDATRSLMANAAKMWNITSTLNHLVTARTKRLTLKNFPLLEDLAGRNFLETARIQIMKLSVESATPVSPVAPASGFAPQSPTYSSEALAEIILNGSQALVEEALIAPSVPDFAKLYSVAATTIALTADQTLNLEYNSRAEAINWRSQITKTLNSLQETSMLISTPEASSLYGSAASELSRAALDVSAALHDDINEAIGRLPALHTLNLDRSEDAFLIAHHLFGDSPSSVEAGYQSIVKRNKPRHPAQMQAGIIEVER